MTQGSELTPPPVPALHHAAEQHVTETGWRVICGCGTEFNASTRDEALANHTGHWRVIKARAALKKENDGED